MYAVILSARLIVEIVIPQNSMISWKSNIFLSFQCLVKLPRNKFYFIEYTKESLNLTWKNYLSNDWLRRDKANSFPVDKFYVNLNWTKTVKGPWKNRTLRLRSIFDVLQVAGPTAVNILIEGENFSNILHNGKAKASERTSLVD